MSRKHLSSKLKNQIIARAGGRCEYCMSLLKYSPQPFTIEHIIPLAMEGATEPNNLALACGGCNGHKYTKIEGIDPVSGSLVPLYNPREEKWSDHFQWTVDYLHIIGITPTGRATVQTLNLNRKELVNLREITLMTREHPPSTE